VVLVSTYEMGRQPFGVASAAAWLGRAGWDVRPVDAGKAPLEDAVLASADLIAFHLPMHTATRLAGPVIVRARRVNPSARLCGFGLYAPLNAAWLTSLGVDDVIGGEFEEALTAIARSVSASGRSLDPSTHSSSSRSASTGDTPGTSDIPALGAAGRSNGARLPRIQFLVPDRSALPPLSRYATLQMPDGARRQVGYTEASRGCRHLCRHCPVVPVYQGEFRVVQADVVLADIAAQVAAGARHITFGDPDFFNGPTHAMRLVHALHALHPAVTYDVTIKVEHLLQHRQLLPRLASTGCAFVVSAVESVDDHVLTLLDKGHTRADFLEAVALCRAAGVTLAPTFVAFHPWLTLDSYCDLLDTIAGLELINHVAPIQLAIRLLLPHGSRLLDLDDMRPYVGAFDAVTLTHQWAHPDPRVDALQRDVMAIVAARITADRRSVFDGIRALAHQRAGHAGVPERSSPARDRATVPYLNEPWFC
jgi:radical SAM superfamily enzyme YgiQ (UPF0313 family)